MTPVVEVHHRLPRRLLSLHERANDPDFVGEALSVWLEWETEAERYGVDPFLSREVLEARVEGSTVELTYSEHRFGEHSEDWSRWGRLGGLATFERYGPDYFALLARRRWKRIRAELLQEYRARVAGVA